MWGAKYVVTTNETQEVANLGVNTHQEKKRRKKTCYCLCTWPRASCSTRKHATRLCSLLDIAPLLEVRQHLVRSIADGRALVVCEPMVGSLVGLHRRCHPRERLENCQECVEEVPVEFLEQLRAGRLALHRKGFKSLAVPENALDGRHLQPLGAILQRLGTLEVFNSKAGRKSTGTM